MKWYLASAFVVLISCGTQIVESSNVRSVPSHSLILERDDRPVDGILNRISFSQGDDGSYLVVQTKAWVNRMNGSDISESSNLQTRATCTFKLNETEDTLQNISCVQDLRPVDGPFVGVNVMRNDYGTYDVTQELRYFDRAEGIEKVESFEIGSNLKLK